MKRDDDRRTEFGTGLRARLLRRRALRLGPGRGRLRPAFGEAILHPAALELHPGPVRVDIGFGETQLPGVERAARLEIPDLVPNRGHYRARPGSSRNAFTSRRNSAPVAPSTAR